MVDKNPMTPAGPGSQVCPSPWEVTHTQRAAQREQSHSWDKEITRTLAESQFLPPGTRNRNSLRQHHHTIWTFLPFPFGSSWKDWQPIWLSAASAFVPKSLSPIHRELLLLPPWDEQCCSGDSPQLGEAPGTQRAPAQPQWTAKDFAKGGGIWVAFTFLGKGNANL